MLVEKKPNIFECRCLFFLENSYFLSCVGTEKVFVHNKPHLIMDLINGCAVLMGLSKASDTINLDIVLANTCL